MLDRIDPTGRSVGKSDEDVSSWRDIEVDERIGSIRVRDPRVFRSDRRSFCRQLLENVTRRMGVSKAEVDLASASCRISFVPGSATAQEMATAFSDAVREAVALAPGADRTRWWRRGPDWFALTAYPLLGDVSLWETIEQKRGRVRLRHRELSGDYARVSMLADAISALPGVAECHVSRWYRCVTIDFPSESPAVYGLLDDVEQVLEDAASEAPLRADARIRAVGPEREPAIAIVSGLRRPMYLALGGGSFAMALVGLVLPGIPTVPFLLASSFYLARSSPALDARLRRTAFFGPILSEWEQARALSRWSKQKLIGLTAAIILVTVVFAPLTPITLVVILVFSSLSIYALARTRDLPDEAAPTPRLEQPTRLALLAP